MILSSKFPTSLQSLPLSKERRNLAILVFTASIVILFFCLSMIYILLPIIIKKIDLTRSLFLWDPMPKIPKVFLLLIYVFILTWGMLLIALVLRIFNAPESSVVSFLSRTKRWMAVLFRPRLKVAVSVVVICSLPLAWALFLTPFKVPNEFLALQTENISPNGKNSYSLDFIKRKELEGLVIPSQDSSSRPPILLKLRSQSNLQEAKNLALRFPELYWFDEKASRLEIHRIGTTSQYDILLNITAPQDQKVLQCKYREDMGDALALATRQYTLEEKNFLKSNRPELERSLVLGRFFYHHNFIFSPAIAQSKDPNFKYGSQYGKGLTKGFSCVLSAVPEYLSFNVYLLLLYASYPIYLVFVIAVSYYCGFRKWQIYFVVAATTASFLISDIETVRLGVGLAPTRHLFDVVVLCVLWRYSEKPTSVNWLMLAFFTFLAIYWSREMGLFIGLSSVGALVALAVQQCNLRMIWPSVNLLVVVCVSWLTSDPHAQTLMRAVLLGANSPNIPWGIITGLSIVSCCQLVVWLWLTRYLIRRRYLLGWWCMFGAAIFYTTASGVYLIFYPRLHHLAPVLPVWAIGLTSGWAIWMNTESRKYLLERLMTVVSGSILLLILGLVGLGTLRTVEVIKENNIFKSHVVHRWHFPAAQLESTGEPEIINQSVDMICRYNPTASVDILSPWEASLMPLSGKGKNGPFVLSFDSLLTENEVEKLANHLVLHGNDILFVDSRIISGQYELPLLESAYLQNRVLSSTLRLRAHTMPRMVFNRIQGCYKMREQGPIISAWQRVSSDCLHPKQTTDTVNPSSLP